VNKQHVASLESLSSDCSISIHSSVEEVNKRRSLLLFFFHYNNKDNIEDNTRIDKDDWAYGSLT